MAQVFIGVDPHKLSATIEVVDEHETALATGRFDTDRAGYAAMRKTVSENDVSHWATTFLDHLAGTQPTHSKNTRPARFS